MALIDINWSPSRRDLRIFGIGGGIFFTIVGAWLAYKGAVIGPRWFLLFTASTLIGLFRLPGLPRAPGIVFCGLLAGMGIATRWAGVGFGPVTLWGIAVVLLIAAWTVPGKLHGPYIAWMTMAFPIGWVVSHVLMAVIFFGLFTFVAIIFRLIGRDTMTRRFEPDLESYWIPRRPVDSKKRYFKQF